MGLVDQENLGESENYGTSPTIDPKWNLSYKVEGKPESLSFCPLYRFHLVEPLQC